MPWKAISSISFWIAIMRSLFGTSILFITAFWLQPICIDARNPSQSHIDKMCYNKDNVMLALPDSCNQFVMCNSGQAIVTSCGANLQFSERLGHCDSPEVVKCISNKIPLTYEDGIRTPVVFAHKPKLITQNVVLSKERDTNPLHSVPKPQSPEETIADEHFTPYCHNIADGKFLPKPESCGHFYVCLLQRAYRRTCPNGLHYSVPHEACMDPDIAQCEKTLVSFNMIDKNVRPIQQSHNILKQPSSDVDDKNLILSMLQNNLKLQQSTQFSNPQPKEMYVQKEHHEKPQQLLIDNTQFSGHPNYLKPQTNIRDKDNTGNVVTGHISKPNYYVGEPIPVQSLAQNVELPESNVYDDFNGIPIMKQQPSVEQQYAQLPNQMLKKPLINTDITEQLHFNQHNINKFETQGLSHTYSNNPEINNPLSFDNMYFSSESEQLYPQNFNYNGNKQINGEQGKRPTQFLKQPNLHFADNKQNQEAPQNMPTIAIKNFPYVFGQKEPNNVQHLGREQNIPAKDKIQTPTSYVNEKIYAPIKKDDHIGYILQKHHLH